MILTVSRRQIFVLDTHDFGKRTNRCSQPAYFQRPGLQKSVFEDAHGIRNLNDTHILYIAGEGIKRQVHLLIHNK